MTFELQQLRQVIALAEHGSFVRAAAALHLSQPALSRSIASLERRFGSALFLRRKSGVEPTDLGRLFVERARDVLRLADQLDREAVSEVQLRSGRVAVGGGPFPVEAVLAPATGRFVERHPGVQVRVVAQNWDELARQLRGRELDFFMAETSTLQHDPDLEVVPLGAAHPVYFFARAGHPLAGGGARPISEILSWPFVSPSRIPPRMLDPLLAAQRQAARQGGPAQPFPAVECNAVAPVKRIVRGSNVLGASILPCIAPELESGEFVVLGREPWMHLNYGIVRLARHPLTQVAERFREFVLEAESAIVDESARLIREYGGGPARGPRAGRARRPTVRSAARPY